MKHLYRLFALTAVLAAFVACSKESEIPEENNPASSEGGFVMTVKAGSAETKTAIVDNDEGKTYDIYWSAGDQIGVYEVANGVVQATKYESTGLGEGGNEASFSVPFLTPAPTKPYKYAFVYPSSALGITEINSQNQYTVCLKQNQTFEANSFDASADVMVSELVEAAETRPSTVEASFARVGATARMVIKCPTTTETIQSITFSTTDNYISGYTSDALI